MNLTTTPEYVDWPATHHVFVEKPAPFSENAQKAWQELHAIVPTLPQKPQHFFTTYQLQPTAFYRAGFEALTAPSDLPKGLRYEKFAGGRYAKFTLRGSYMQLPEACGQVFKRVEEMKMKVRAGLYIENYVNDPKTTPEADLITEILIPV